MKKLVPILSVLVLITLTGCKTIQDWFQKEKPEVEIISKNIIKITDQFEFKNKVLNSNKLTIVKFETDWCGACKQMAPTYEKAASNFTNINFTTVDADDLADLAKTYKIQGVPTLIFFKDGKIIDQIDGSMEENAFFEKIKEINK